MRPQQRAEAIKLRAAGLGWRTIAEMVGSTRWKLIKELDPEQHKKNQLRAQAFYEQNGKNKSGDLREIPEHVLADRERRINAPQRTFGDPPFGYSALDKKRNAQPSA